MIRDIQTITAPALSRNLPSDICASKRPFEGWDGTDPKELARWEMKFTARRGEQLDVPNEVLEPVFRIADLPVSEVVERAKADFPRDFASFTENRPFTGLVKANPRKALASLSYSARKGDHPTALWTALIDEWPEATSPRLFRTFLNRLARLPDEVISSRSATVSRYSTLKTGW